MRRFDELPSRWPPSVPFAGETQIGVPSAPLVELLEGLERRAWVQAFKAAPRRLKNALGLEVEECESATALRSPGADTLFFNRTFIHPGRSCGSSFDALLRRYEELGIGRYLIHLPPSESAGPARAWLLRRGLAPFTRHWVKFVGRRMRTPRVYTDLSIRRADESDADSVGRILAHGFNVPESGGRLFASLTSAPGWTAFVACDDGCPVGAALSYASDGVACLAGAATLPSHRRRGGQAALLEARIGAALAEGCETVSCETGELRAGGVNVSYRNLIRVGLSPVYVRENFAPVGVTWTPA